MRVHKEHRIECSASRFFEIMFDPEFERRMNLVALAAQGCEVLERQADGPTWRMRIRTRPKDNLPGFLKKLVGDAFAIEETRTYEQGSERASGQMVPSVLKDKVRMSYELRVVPEGEGACRRIMDWDIEVKIFGVGGQIEKFAAAEIERGTEASARFLNDHARGQPAS